MAALRRPAPLVAVLIAACGGGGGGTQDAGDPAAGPGDSLLPEVERQAIERFERTPVAVRGRVLAPGGTPLAGARVRIGEVERRTGADGSFALEGLPRRNALLEVSAQGMRTALVPLHLHRPVTLAEVGVEPVVLASADPQTARFLFGGDVSFGRRFLDPDDATPRGRIPPDRPDALIRASDPLPGSRAALDFVRPLLDAADYRIVNLETPVTDNPATPHPTKEFAFFSLPGSLPALAQAGVDYVSLGNNHVYDYLEAGLADTLRFVEAAGLAHSGAGLDAAQAWAPWRATIAGSPYSFLSATTVSGSEHPVSYVAEAAKGGAADMRDDAVTRRAFEAERTAGRIPIGIVHTGQEYTERPSDYALGRMRLAASSGAALVIAHHPHVAQGFSRHEGVLLAHSLGNFVFDQDRLETMLGLLAQVDMRAGSVRRAEAVPIYLEDYRPRLIAGALADRLLRRIGEDSRGNAVTVLSRNSLGIVLRADEAAVARDRELSLPVAIPASGWAIVDLREHLRSGESLAGASAAAQGYRLTAGRDRLEHGDFEDHDIDDQSAETPRWNTSGRSSFACLHAPRSGAVALCSTRSPTDAQDSVVAFRNRIRVLGDTENRPNRALTLYGWLRGDNAGPLAIVSRYYASAGETEFGEERALSHPGGRFDWEPFAVDLRMPSEAGAGPEGEEARALRLFLRHSPPAGEAGLASFDDLVVINWEPGTAGTTLRLETPHMRDFVRIEGPPGKSDLRVVLRRHELGAHAP